MTSYEEKYYQNIKSKKNMQIECPHCGKINEKENNFCKYCGGMLRGLEFYNKQVTRAE